jgi:hypothetical protein
VANEGVDAGGAESVDTDGLAQQAALALEFPALQEGVVDEEGAGFAERAGVIRQAHIDAEAHAFAAGRDLPQRVEGARLGFAEFEVGGPDLMGCRRDKQCESCKKKG